ncbi:hemin uptake protein HemP [Methylocystis echinoides]|uniref:hemin uptake protein HemP n=1 Tax=Methylocystis echinoides TaxID=29468 RepID=UPI0034302CDA
MSTDFDEQPLPPPPLSPEDFPKEYFAHELIGEGIEAIIIHEGERYRLRITPGGN